MSDPSIKIRSWVKSSDDDVRAGLLGYISVFYGDLILDGLTVRRTADGRLAISFPARQDRQGRRHPYVRPVDDAARLRIERAIFGESTVAEGVAW